MVVLLTGGRQGGDGAAVETVFQGDYGVIVGTLLVKGVFPGGLYDALVGLGAGVGEEDLFHAGLLAEHLGQNGTGLGVVEVGHVLELAQLLYNGFLPFLVGNAEGGDADAAAHVDVLFALLVIDQGAFAADQFHREAGVGVCNILFVDGFDVSHFYPLLLP